MSTPMNPLPGFGPPMGGHTLVRTLANSHFMKDLLHFGHSQSTQSMAHLSTLDEADQKRAVKTVHNYNDHILPAHEHSHTPLSSSDFNNLMSAMGLSHTIHSFTNLMQGLINDFKALLPSLPGFLTMSSAQQHHVIRMALRQSPAYKQLYGHVGQGNPAGGAGHPHRDREIMRCHATLGFEIAGIILSAILAFVSIIAGAFTLGVTAVLGVLALLVLICLLVAALNGHESCVESASQIPN